jgi:c-di-GMP-binding flagellar brake protein YcgR
MNLLGGSMLFYPLQINGVAYFKQTNPRDYIVFGIGIMVVVLILIIVNIVKRKYNPKALGGSIDSSSIGHFSGFTLRHLANNFGLDHDQTKMLEFVLKNDGVTDLEKSLASANLLDRHFKHAFHIIERTSSTDTEVQEKLSLLFSTRNILDSSSGGEGISSTRNIPENASAVLNIAQDSFPVRIVSSRGESLVVENPKNALGTPVRLPRGGKVTLSFFTKSSKGFSFESRILGTSESAEGPVLQLLHSSQMKQLSKRRFRRRQGVIPSTFYYVFVEDSGRKNEKKMVVDKRRLTGNIMDISIGGCSVKTGISVPSGTRLKLEFMYSDSLTAAVLGQVLRTNRTGMSTIMHIKFLKVPRRSLNAINALVYEYADI